ncbi:MAG: peptide chain release factor N(5)-glutamine methyltransferase [Bacilli bacterium]|nr:peptide chain release factor N(5)-glutamine methyltransferase [Bacilli bacterium]
MTYEQFCIEQCRIARDLNKEERAVKTLLMENSGLSATELYLHYSEAIPKAVLKKTKADLRLYFYKNKPIQYIIGYTYFYGLKLFVNQDVLIPRPETELLVEKVLEKIEGVKNLRILDLGTGSGAIALALKKNRKDAILIASDISEKALEVAILNARHHKLEINFRKSNLFDNIESYFNVLVSNPPYIDAFETIDPLVSENEPNDALYAEEKGLYYYQEILRNANLILEKNNLIVFEIPENKDQELMHLVKTYYPDSEFEIIKDYNHLSRILVIKNYWRKHL